MGCAESVAVSRPSHNNSSTNTAKPKQLRKKRSQRRPSQEEQVLGELPQPGEFDSSQGQQEQRSHYSDNKSSSCSGSLGPSSGAGESNPLRTREALPPRRKSIDSMEGPEPSLLSITAGVVPDDNDAQPFVRGIGAEVDVPTGGDSQQNSADSSKFSGGSSANTAIWKPSLLSITAGEVPDGAEVYVPTGGDSQLNSADSSKYFGGSSANTVIYRDQNGLEE